MRQQPDPLPPHPALGCGRLDDVVRSWFTRPPVRTVRGPRGGRPRRGTAGRAQL